MRSEKNRIENRSILAHYDWRHPTTMGGNRGSYMCAYGHCLLEAKKTERKAALWFYLAAAVGNEEAKGIFKRRKILIKGKKRSVCIRMLIKQWQEEE